MLYIVLYEIFVIFVEIDHKKLKTIHFSLKIAEQLNCHGAA